MRQRLNGWAPAIALVLIATVLDMSFRTVPVHAQPERLEISSDAWITSDAWPEAKARFDHLEPAETADLLRQRAEALNLGLPEWAGQENATSIPLDSAASTDGTGDTAATSLPQAQGVSPHAVALPSSAGSTLGLGESFAPQLSTGALTFRVPVELPPARGRVQPNLDLGYSSAGGFGIAGQGWSAGAPAISRQTDRGTPSFLDLSDYHVGQDRFLLGGTELVPLCKVSGGACVPGETFPPWAEGWQYFRSQREGVYMRVFWSPDHQTWRVQGQDGTTAEFGVPLDGSRYQGGLERDPAHPDHISRWYVVRQYDNAGDVDKSGLPSPVNIVTYRYQSDLGTSYLSDVYYTAPADRPDTAPLSEWAHHVHLAYGERPDWVTSFRAGFETTSRRRLTRIDIATKPFQGLTTAPRALVRRYHLEYFANRHTSLLASVSMEGRCPSDVTEAANQELPFSTCPRLPAIRFDYQQGNDKAEALLDQQGYAFEPLGHSVEEIEDSPPHNLSERGTALTDVNGDGLADLLVTQPSKYDGMHAVYFGRGGSDYRRIAYGAPEMLPVLGASKVDAAVLSLGGKRVAALDANGDGVIDLLHTSTSGAHTAFSLAKGSSGYSWQPRPGSTGTGTPEALRSARDSADVRVLDANGDGFVDFVVTRPGTIETHFSLARFPGGQGRFGSAESTGPAWSLSDEPVRTCAPWSALPIRFSDGDVHTADMNGDGLVDIVRVRSGQIIVWPGRGNGFWGTGDREDCFGSGYAVDRHIELENAPHFGYASGGRLFLADVNGDGFSDLTEVRATGADVYLNDSGMGFTERHVIDDVPFGGGLALAVEMTDLNGNGTADLVWGRADRYEMVDLAAGVQPHLLTRVDNGLGGTNEFEYQSSTEHMRVAASQGKPWQASAPITAPLVIRATTRDNLETVGFSGGRYVAEYRYRDPLFVGTDRSFRGFQQAEVRTLGDASSPTSVTTTSFVYGPCESTLACARSPEKGHLSAVDALPILVEQHNGLGLYLSTEHTGYALTELYKGRDGRRVVAVRPTQVDSYRYDTSAFVAGTRKDTLTDVSFALNGASQSEIVHSVPVRASTGTAHIRARYEYDAVGHMTLAVSEGCVDGCPAGADEAVTTYSKFELPVGDRSGWQWREVHSYTTGARHPSRRGEVRRKHDAYGNLVESRAVLSGTVGLYRVHAAGGAVAPAPGDSSGGTSTPVEIITGQTSYDRFGNATRVSLAGGRCAQNEFDGSYATHVTRTHRFVGGKGADGCGTRDLWNDYAYDRGLNVVTAGTSVDGQPSAFTFDGFGRLTAITESDPQHPGQLGPNPSQLLTYWPPTDATQTPYSVVETSTLDGANNAESTYLVSYKAIDGLGRELMSISEADPSQGDAGDYVISGIIDRNAKGLGIRAYEPRFLANEGMSAPIGQWSQGGRFSSQRYDTFGRVVETTGLDGAKSSRVVHHPLSADAYDALDDQVGGPRFGTYSTQVFDGFGRSRESVTRVIVNGQLELHRVRLDYLPSGETERVVQSRQGSPDVVRWFRYDSLGRLVLNAEPNTSLGFTADPEMAIANLRAHRYAYNDAGDLVGVSDARGCGVNYHYDAGGRITAADRSPCLAEHAAYTPPNLATGDGTEAFYRYDEAPSDAGTAVDAAGRPFALDAARLKGRLVSTSDRAVRTLYSYSALGELIGVAKQLARPGSAAATLASRYAPRWYVKAITLDAASRVVKETSGASQGASTQGGESWVGYRYSGRGALIGVQSSYGALVHSAVVEATGQTTAVTYGDVAATERAFSYDTLQRLSTVQTFRGPPPLWSQASPPVGYPPPVAGSAPTRQLALEDSELKYDAVGNITQIVDWRDPSLWPVSHGPVTRTFEYDDAYHLARTSYSYAGAAPWMSPYAAENAGQATDKPSPHVSFAERPKTQTYGYDHLGNQIRTTDDAGGFYDRSLGLLSYGTPSRGPHQLTKASNRTVASGSRLGDLDIAYDAAGNMTDMVVRRDGGCLPSGASCWQRFRYDFSETSELARARRWDLTAAERPTLGLIPSALPTRVPQADLRYAYDSAGLRTRKTAADGAGAERHTLYVFSTLELRSSDWTGTDYRLEARHEHVLLPMGGHGFARVFVTQAALPEVEGNQRHVLLNLSDHIGSGTISIDRETSELAERTTYMAYGARESDYRPDRWGALREPYGFGGKEEDIEVGLSYFGARYYSPYLGVWLSPDPGTIHELASDLNPYSYAGGTPLMKVDPDGRYVAIAAGGCLIVFIVAAIVIGAAVGAGLGMAAYGTRVAITGEPFKWGLDGLGGAALVGGVTGAVSGGIGAVSGPIAGALVGGALSGGIGDMMTQKFGGADSLDWGQVGISAGIGMGIGLLTYGVGVGINKAFRGTPKASGTGAKGTPETGGHGGGQAAESAGSGSGAGSGGGAGSAVDDAFPSTGVSDGEILNPTHVTDDMLLGAAGKQSKQLGNGPKAPSPEMPTVEPDNLTLPVAKATPEPSVCFPAGTLIATPEGVRAIEDLEPGELVWSFDFATGEVVARPVLQTFARKATELVEVSYGPHTVRSTPSHPYWVDGLGWLPAGELTIGMILHTRDQEPVEITDLRVRLGQVPVFNLEVGDTHSFYVGEPSVLVHNMSGKGGRPQVTLNKEAGDAFRDEIADQFEKAGYEVEKEVVKETPFGLRKMDIQVSKDGQVLGGIETKVGGSRYLPSQRAKDEWLRRTQGYPVNVVRDK